MEEEPKRQRVAGLDLPLSSIADEFDVSPGMATVATAVALAVEPENGSKAEQTGQSGLCSICQCEKSARFYILNTGARVLVTLAAGFIPRGLNYAEMCACTACYQALTSSRSKKWSSGSTRNALLVDCETLVLQSPPLIGAAKVQLSGGTRFALHVDDFATGMLKIEYVHSTQA
jgi:hypothetical protein